LHTYITFSATAKFISKEQETIPKHTACKIHSPSQTTIVTP